MKQLLFLLLFPCLAMAQYPGNAGQKITLGEQTTADGLVFRGVANDTNVITPFSDTSAYIILDTVNSKFYHYNRTTTYWSLAGGGVSVTSFSGGSTGLTPSTATTGAVTLGGTLAVANGGTNRTTMPAGYILHGDGTSVDTSVNLFWDRTNSRLGIGTQSPLKPLHLNMGIDKNFTIVPASEIYTSGLGVGMASRLDNGSSLSDFSYRANNVIFNIGSGGVWIHNNPDVSSRTESLDVQFNARFRAVGAGAYANDLNITSTGVLTTASSDEKYKYNILPINYGLNTILQLKPVNFQWIKGEENDLGFIAQDVADIIPEAVDTNWNSDLLMRYESIIPILTKAIQEQNALIKALEQRIINLENK